MIDKLLAEQGRLDIVHPNITQLLEEDHASFAMVRRSGLGASDSSIYLGVNKWKDVDELIDEKLSIGYTDKEREVSEKEAVRKGSDLEPIILKYFQKTFGVEVQKPSAMYRIIAHPQLTINYDGIWNASGKLIPVECKFCSVYANKYWDRSKTITRIYDGSEYRVAGANIVDHIIESATLYGIPPYYYTQVQQQMLGTEAPFCYMAVIFDKGWEFGAYRIYRDKYVQDALINESSKVWSKIQAKRQTV